MTADLLQARQRDRQKRVGGGRIELRPGTAPDLFERRRQRPLATVRAVRRHRVERVGHSDDSRNQGDVVALEAVRIALAVVPLVMMPYRLGLAREELQRLEDLVADHRMGADQLELLFRELT